MLDPEQESSKLPSVDGDQHAAWQAQPVPSSGQYLSWAFRSLFVHLLVNAE
jgi:hypothetical protein